MACLSRQRLPVSAFSPALFSLAPGVMRCPAGIALTRPARPSPRRQHVWSLRFALFAGACRRRCQREERRENEHDDPVGRARPYASRPATRRAAASRRGAAAGGEPRGLARPGAAEPGGTLVRADTPRRQPRGVGDQLAAGPGDRVPRPRRVGRRVRRGLGHPGGAPGGRGQHHRAGAGQAGRGGRGAGVRPALHPRRAQRGRRVGGGQRARLLAAAAGHDAL